MIVGQLLSLKEDFNWGLGTGDLGLGNHFIFPNYQLPITNYQLPNE
jgi:hypothetical protein